MHQYFILKNDHCPYRCRDHNVCVATSYKGITLQRDHNNTNLNITMLQMYVCITTREYVPDLHYRNRKSSFNNRIYSGKTYIWKSIFKFHHVQFIYFSIHRLLLDVFIADKCGKSASFDFTMEPSKICHYV